MLKLKTKIENQSNKTGSCSLVNYLYLLAYLKKIIYCCLFIERVHTPPPIFIVNIYETPYPQMTQP